MSKLTQSPEFENLKKESINKQNWIVQEIVTL